MRRALLIPLGVAMLATTFGTIPIQGATKNWIGGHGPWSLGGNWNGGTVPALFDAVNITPSDGLARTVSYDVSAPTLGVLTIDMTGAGTSRATFLISWPPAKNLTTSGFLVGSNGRGTFDHSGGTVTTNHTGLDSVLGHGASGDGIYNLSETGTLSIARDLYVGNFGTGAFNQTGGTNTIHSNLLLAAQSNSVGVYTLSGGGLSVARELIVGRGGTGRLNIIGRELVSSATGVIGALANSDGTATVDGLGSKWSNTGDLTIGNSGTGALKISGDAQVFNQNGNIGVDAGSSGMVSVDGNAVWSNRSVVAVGIAGTGSLSITDSIVYSTNGRIAREAGSRGTVVIDGQGSRWLASGVFTMGLAGAGTAALEVRNGGNLTAAGGMTIGPLGTVRGDGTLQANVNNTSGVIAPSGPGNSPGTLHITGNYQQSVGGKLQIELAAASFDKLDVTGEITLDNTLFGPPMGGTLEVSLIDDYVPQGTQSFDILDWSGSLSGTFTSIQLPTLGGTLVWDASQLYTTGVLSVDAAVVDESILVSNLAQPPRAASPIGNNPNPADPPEGPDAPWSWAAQSFQSDNQEYSLSSIEAVVGNGSSTPPPVVVAELRADREGTIGDLIATFTAPDVSGAPTALEFLPDNQVTLEANTQYWFVLGSENPGDGTFTWQYAEGDAFVGRGTLGGFADTTESGANWSYGAGNPYHLQVNVGPARTLLGDFNQDGTVDAADYVVWRDGLGTTYTQADYDVWRANYGATAGSGSGATAGPVSSADAAIPEPATWAIILAVLCVSALGTFGRRRTCGVAPVYRLLPSDAPRVVQFAVLVLLSPHLSGRASATSWTNPGLGNWFVASNWSGGVLPSAMVQADISQGTALISFLLNPHTFASAFTLRSSGSGSLTISDAQLQVLNASYIGETAGSNSFITVSGLGSLWDTPTLEVGRREGSGTIRVENSGRVESRLVWLGADSESNGSMTVTGGAGLIAYGQTLVGKDGSGSLTISNGGYVLGKAFDFSSNCYIGYSTGSTGSVNVTGAHSEWIVGIVHVGAPRSGGLGTLQISNGGMVEASHLKVFATGLAQVNNGSSTVSGLTIVGGDVTGPESSPLGALIIANTASARMVVQSGGTVSNSLGTIGANVGTVGSVLVHGAGSRWTNTDQVSVGHNGVGTLEVRNGGTLTSVRGFAGAGAFSTGTITVSDPGSTWNASGSFFIGNSGSGSLEILNGGVASTAGNCHLGITVGATGDVNVSGTGSTLNVAALMNIGGDSAAARGTGSLRIADGGTVNVSSATNLYSTGTLDLANATTFTGDMNAYGGLIRTSGDATLTNTVHLNAGGVIVETNNQDGSAVFNGNIDGPGGLTKRTFFGLTGKGTLTLTAANTYTGATTVHGGTLLIDGSITSATTVNTGASLGGSGSVGTVTIKNGGVIAPGKSPGVLTAAAVTFDNAPATSAATLAIELSGTAPGTQYDQLHVTGPLALGGTLAVSLINGFTPVAGNSFDILDWGTLSGTFATLALPTLDGLAWNTSQLYTTGVLSIAAAGLRGDFNLDGTINALDIDLLAADAARTVSLNLDLYDLNNDDDVTFTVGPPGAPSVSDSDVLIREILQTRYGDADLNGQVFLSDLIKLATNYRQAGQFGWADGNFNGSQEAGSPVNPRVSLSDLIVLATNWRFGVGGAGAAVPEPSGLVLALCWLIGTLNPRARREHAMASDPENS